MPLISGMVKNTTIIIQIILHPFYLMFNDHVYLFAKCKTTLLLQYIFIKMLFNSLIKHFSSEDCRMASYFRLNSACADIWYPQCGQNQTHTHTHTESSSVLSKQIYVWQVQMGVL